MGLEQLGQKSPAILRRSTFLSFLIKFHIFVALDNRLEGSTIVKLAGVERYDAYPTSVVKRC